MKRVVGLILLIIGVWLIHSGWTRRESLAGKAEAKIAEIGRKLDGESRAPDYLWQLAGGGVLVLAGAVLLIAKPKS